MRQGPARTYLSSPARGRAGGHLALKILAVAADPAYGGGALFDPASRLNRDDCLSPFRALKSALEARGWDCVTDDQLPPRAAPDAALFLDVPTRMSGPAAAAPKKYVLLQECEVVKPANWLPGAHDRFDGIFTWDPRLVDNRRYFKVNFANHFPALPPPGPEGRDKLCAMIAGHKRRAHPLELYTERERTIRWFEAEHPEDFDLYGAGWDRRVFDGPLPLRALNRLAPLARLLAEPFPSYRGPVESKLPVLSRYRFAVCYENARDIPGYVTEKIFDAFFAGCVPVYLGAPEIADLIPPACFVDRRAFGSHEELYGFLRGMSVADHAARQAAIAAYLASPAAEPYTDGYFGGTIAKVVSGA